MRLIFSIWVFLQEHSRVTGQLEKEDAIFSIPPYIFLPTHRQLDISRAITAENSPLHIASSQTPAGNLWFPRASRNQIITLMIITTITAIIKKTKVSCMKNKIHVFQQVHVNPFLPNAPFLCPLKTASFSNIFRGVEKGCIKSKWINWPGQPRLAIQKT